MISKIKIDIIYNIFLFVYCNFKYTHYIKIYKIEWQPCNKKSAYIEFEILYKIALYT
jgi:hypothetical protein